MLLETSAEDCRTRLIRAAKEIFIDEGCSASIERVASRAGVARQTLYNHFDSKDELIGEVVRQVTEILLVTLDDAPITLRERLLRFGLTFRGKVLSAEGLGFYRALIAESIHRPELAATFYQAGPAKTVARLTEIMRQAIEEGELRADLPEFVTTMLLSMLIGEERNRSLLTGQTPSATDPEHVARIIDSFLRAFKPDGVSPIPSTPWSIP